jgi:hypothetical protein
MAVKDRLDLNETRNLCDQLFNAFGRHARAFERKGDVVAHGQRRIEGIAFKGHGDGAARRRHLIDPSAREHNISACDILETGDHAQRRGLAAAGRAEQRNDVAIVDAHVQGLRSMDLRLPGPSINFVDAIERKHGIGHRAHADCGGIRRPLAASKRRTAPGPNRA